MNDGKIEYQTEKTNEKKQHNSDEEEEYFSRSQNSQKSEDDIPDQDRDKYDTLKLAQDQKEGGFKYDPNEDRYYL